MIIDATAPLANTTPVWPGEPTVQLELSASIVRGDSCNVTQLSTCCHAGTHLDAPRHFIDDGICVDQLDLDALVGPCYVADLSGVTETITKQHLETIPACDRLVFKTANTARRLMHSAAFTEDYCHIGLDAAELIVERRLKLVGVDYLSIEVFGSPDHKVHDTILGSGIIAVEGLLLDDVTQGWWEIICLPLKIKGSDGSPVRAFFRSLS